MPMLIMRIIGRTAIGVGCFALIAGRIKAEKKTQHRPDQKRRRQVSAVPAILQAFLLAGLSLWFRLLGLVTLLAHPVSPKVEL